MYSELCGQATGKQAQQSKDCLLQHKQSQTESTTNLGSVRLQPFHNKSLSPTASLNPTFKGIKVSAQSRHWQQHLFCHKDGPILKKVQKMVQEH